MIPVQQTILHDPSKGQHGNCLSAVLASLLHLDIAYIPVFGEETWVQDLNAWLRPHGLAYFLVSGFPEYVKYFGIQGCYHEIAVASTRHVDTDHAIVAVDGVPVFDPHPDGDSLGQPVKLAGLFVALEPWKVSEAHRSTAINTQTTVEPINQSD